MRTCPTPVRAARRFHQAIAALLAAGASLLTAHAMAQAPSTAARYDAARGEYEIGHYQLAFDEFAALADGGHCDAKRTVQQMLRYGRVLYGMEFKASVERRERWQRLPGCAALSAASR